MSQLINFPKDNQGTPITDAFPITVDMKSVSLLTLANQSFSVPNTLNHWLVNFSYGANAEVWVAVNDTAAAPGGNTFATTTSVLNPKQLKVSAGDTINCYNAAGSTIAIGVSLYQLN